MSGNDDSATIIISVLAAYILCIWLFKWWGVLGVLSNCYLVWACCLRRQKKQRQARENSSFVINVSIENDKK